MEGENNPDELLERLQDAGCLCLISKEKENDEHARVHICVEEREKFDHLIKMTGAEITSDNEVELVATAMVEFTIGYDK